MAATACTFSCFLITNRVFRCLIHSTPHIPGEITFISTKGLRRCIHAPNGISKRWLLYRAKNCSVANATNFLMRDRLHHRRYWLDSSRGCTRRPRCHRGLVWTCERMKALQRPTKHVRSGASTPKGSSVLNCTHTP